MASLPTVGGSNNTWGTENNAWVGTSLDVADGTLKAPTGGAATFVVAASNAPARIKKLADYVCDGTADEVEINAAITALPTVGGHIVLTPGLFNVAATVSIQRSYVTLEGMGCAGDVTGSGTDNATTLRWKGADNTGPVVDIQSPGTSTQLKGVSLIGFTVQCSSGTGNLASVGISVKNVGCGRFHHLEIRNAQSAAFATNSKAVSSGAKGVFYCNFKDIFIRNAEATGANGDGFVLDGVDNAGNTYANTFDNCFVIHANGVGWRLKNCDTNTFINCTGNRLSGTGLSLELGGSNTAGLNCRRNVFIGFSQDGGNGGITARGTGFTFPSAANVFYGYTTGNSNPLPTVETGATLWAFTNDGLLAGGATIGLDFNSGTFTYPYRLKNNTFVLGRNAAGTGDVAMFGLDTSDTVQFQAAIRAAAGIIVANTQNITFSQSTGTKIGTNTAEKIAFWNATPIARPSAYTQTFSTADKTHAARTSAATATTASTQTTPWGFSTQAQADAIVTNLNAVRADLDDTAQLLNSVIDDLQALGLVG